MSRSTLHTEVLQSLILLVYIALITFSPSLQFMPKYIVWFVDRQRLLELLLLTLILVFSLLHKPDLKNSIFINSKLRNAFFILLALASLSSLFAVSQRLALIEISVFAGLCYLALFVSNLYVENKEDFTKKLTYTIWASLLLYLVSFYSGYITATIFKTPLNWPFPFTGFSNIRSFNQYQLWTLGLISLPLLAFDLQSKVKRFCLYFALTLWWVLLFYSASRGVLIAWLLGALMTAVVYQKIAWLFLKSQLIQIASGYISYYILFKIIPAIHQSTIVTSSVIRETTNDRIALWNLALTIIKNFPFSGTGPMNYVFYSTTNAHPHNSVLQLATEWGLPATTVILAISGFAIYCWLKKFTVNKLQSLPKLESQLTIILFFTIITNAIYSLVDGVIVTPISQVLMFTVIGLMVGHYSYNRIITIDRNPKFRPVFAGVVLLVLICSTLPEITRGLSGNEKGFSMGYTAIGPRFWFESK